jgi:formyl-CoA transferase
MDICYSRIQNLKEVMDDPLFREREMVVSAEGNNGNEKFAIGVPVKLSKTPGAIWTKPVNFGENTTSVLSSLGYSAEEIKGFTDRDVI